MAQEFLKAIEDWNGFHSVNGVKANETALSEAVALITNRNRLPPHQHKYLMQEAITTTDFPYLFGQIIDRQLLANYKAWVADWRSYVKVAPGGIPDFNTVRREKLLGSDNALEVVPEKGEYKTVKPVNCRYTYALKKYGRQFDISWESIVNDSLSAFSDIPQRFATAAIRTEARFVTGLYADSTAGGNPLLYSHDPGITDCGQVVVNSGHLALTIANLETTLSLMAAQVDPNGETIAVRGIHLVVPPALEFTARAIITSALKQWTDTAAATNFPLPTTNIIPQLGIQLHVDPYLPVINTHAAGGWFVFADPSQGAALEVGYLRGYEAPEIVMKASDKVTVGGGLMSPFSGDFATDNIFYRVRDVFGGTQMDPRFTYFQEGQA
jgi:hypothetical protein